MNIQNAIHHTRLVTGLFSLAIATGCASTKVTRQPLVTGSLPRPGHIWVYDFAATPADFPISSSLRGQIFDEAGVQTAEQMITGRQLGAQIATELVAQLRDMGMPGGHALAGTVLQINDIVLQGALLSFDEGDAAQRVGVGLGKGKSELRAAVEGFQMTAQGLRKLGSGTTDSGGSQTPGAAVGAVTFIATANPAGLIVGTGMKIYGEKTGSSKVAGRAKDSAKEIAAVLKQRFRDQGWLK